MSGSWTIDAWRSTPLIAANSDDGEDVQPEVEQRGEHDRARDRHARELDLADQRLALHERLDAAARRLADEREEHDPREQDDGVVVDGLAEPDELR